MKIGDIVKLSKHSPEWPKGVIGNLYKITKVKQTEFKLCDIESDAYCFYTHQSFVIKNCGCKKIKQKIETDSIVTSVPPGMDFDKDYPLDKKWEQTHTLGKPFVIPDFNVIVDEEISFDAKIDEITNKITSLLKEKNKAYGDSALNPTNIFSKSNATESLCARIDDKLARIKNKGINDKTEDTIDDLIGYLLLLKMSI
jgi:hypothetical protein